ncbi:MAG: MarR family winged helix-turn-helix transcriptional regulator [Treponemataceae bacterium]|nr:MarR family winged helix-turn-helix transcriptional regulator [Treponemataceae bacterium]
MRTDDFKKLLDACFVARRIAGTLQKLPDGLKPCHLRALDTVHDVLERRGVCRVSDVSARFQITMPSVTKLVQELESLGLLEKRPDSTDKRAVLLGLTPAGESCLERYVLTFHEKWAAAMGDISGEQAEEALRLFSRLEETIPRERR